MDLTAKFSRHKGQSNLEQYREISLLRCCLADARFNNTTIIPLKGPSHETKIDQDSKGQIIAVHDIGFYSYQPFTKYRLCICLWFRANFCDRITQKYNILPKNLLFMETTTERCSNIGSRRTDPETMQRNSVTDRALAVEDGTKPPTCLDLLQDQSRL